MDKITLKEAITIAIDYVITMENEKNGIQSKTDAKGHKVSYQDEKKQKLINNLRQNHFSFLGKDRELFMQPLNLFRYLETKDMSTIVEYES